MPDESLLKTLRACRDTVKTLPVWRERGMMIEGLTSAIGAAKRDDLARVRQCVNIAAQDAQRNKAATEAIQPVLTTLAHHSAVESSAIRQTHADIDALAELSRGWDGYSGVPAKPDAIRRAHRVADTVLEHTSIAPHVVPLSDGGIQFDWFSDSHDIEISVSSEGETRAFVTHKSRGGIEEIDLPEPLELAPLKDHLKNLKLRP